MNVFNIIQNSGAQFLSFGISTFTLLALFLVVKQMLISYISRGLQRISSSHRETALAVVSTWNSFVSLVTAVCLSSLLFPISPVVTKTLSFVLLLVLVYISVTSFNKIIAGFISEYSDQQKKLSSDFDPTLLGFFKRFIQALVFVVGLLLVAQNLGYNVTALVGGLGLGGIAIAFAVQNILGDLFSSVSIYFDKPFQVGDTIKIDSDVGTVKKIGLRSTRLQTLDGQELVVANTDITTSRVHNFKRMPKRRVAFQFGITYETSPALVAKIPDLVSSLFSDLEQVELDRVHLIELADYSLVFEVVYFVTSRDFTLYRNVHQQLLLALLKLCSKHGIDFAYPTQLVVEKK